MPVITGLAVTPLAGESAEQAGIAYHTGNLGAECGAGSLEIGRVLDALRYPHS
jgi:hypothetical protein